MPTITVTNLNNVVNGDTSSASALTANDGGDGVSLREAILAADATAGPTTIQFSAALAGQTITLDAAGLPPVTRDGVTITGLTGPGGAPAITIQEGVTPTNSDLLMVQASDFTLSHVAFAHLGRVFAVVVQTPFTPSGGVTGSLSNISITDNSFSNTGYDGASNTNAIYINLPDDAVNGTLQTVLVARNSFTDWAGEADGVLVSAGGKGSVISGVDIRDNSFTNVTYPVEFVGAKATGASIEDNQIVGNTFSGDFQPINLNMIGATGTPTADSTITGTVIVGNLLTNTGNTGISIYAGLDSANGNTISDTWIVNNVIGPSGQGIGINGGAEGATSNTVDGVHIINDTIVGGQFNGVNTAANFEASGNTVSNVTIANTLFYNNGTDIGGPTPVTVSNSLTEQAGYADSSGDVGGDPRFVDLANNDFHLKAGSPAIGAGAGDIAPIVDFDLLGRFDDTDAGGGASTVGRVDIGAYEFTGGQTPVAPPDALQAAITSVLRATPGTAAYAAQAQPIVAELTSGVLTVDAAYTQIVQAAENTSSVATMAYQFFTGEVPSSGGMDFLVNPTGPNANNLNSAYYQSFNIENRYINFAVNLGKLGAGATAFNSAYGSLDLFDATQKAYGVIFGITPSDTKVHALLDATITLGGAIMTRAGYFAIYGGDGAFGIGTKAAMVGWLLAEAVLADVGSYAKSNDAFLTDVATNGAPWLVDMIGHYNQASFAFNGG